MSKKFCPKCGKEVEEFHDNLCSDCFLKPKTSIANMPKSIIVRKCKLCGKYLIDEKRFNSIEDCVEEKAKQLFKKSNIASVSFRLDRKRGKIHFTITSNFDVLGKEETTDTFLVLKNIVCKYCSMKESGYYQTVLQIRLPKDLMESVMDEIVKHISFQNQFDPQAFIAKADRTKEGVDLYIGSKKAANEIVRILRKEIGIKTKFSRKIGGRLKGKEVYRDTILITIQ